MSVDINKIRQAEQLYQLAWAQLKAGQKTQTAKQQLEQASQLAQGDDKLLGLIQNDLKRFFGVGSEAEKLMNLYNQATL